MANKTISTIELTDRDLYWIALSIESHINSRDTYFTQKSAREYNKMVNKIRVEGHKRKDPKAILHPIEKFKDDGE